MGKLILTDDGKLVVNDHKSIYRAILKELYTIDMTVFELVTVIHNNYHEFKYIKPQLIIMAINDLRKQKYIVSTYSYGDL